MSSGRSILRFARDVTLLRRGAPVLFEGRSFPPPITETAIRAAVYPARGDDLEMLPEGQRNKKALWFTSLSELRTGLDPSQHESDQAVVDGEVYDLIRAQHWPTGGYYKAFGVRVAQFTTTGRLYFGVHATYGEEDEPALTDYSFVMAGPSTGAYFQATVDEGEAVFVAVPEDNDAPRVLIDGVEAELGEGVVVGGFLLFQVTGLEPGEYDVEVIA